MERKKPVPFANQVGEKSQHHKRLPEKSKKSSEKPRRGSPRFGTEIRKKRKTI